MLILSDTQLFTDVPIILKQGNLFLINSINNFTENPFELSKWPNSLILLNKSQNYSENLYSLSVDNEYLCIEENIFKSTELCFIEIELLSKEPKKSNYTKRISRKKNDQNQMMAEIDSNNENYKEKKVENEIYANKKYHYEQQKAEREKEIKIMIKAKNGLCYDGFFLSKCKEDGEYNRDAIFIIKKKNECDMDDMDDFVKKSHDLLNNKLKPENKSRNKSVKNKKSRKNKEIDDDLDKLEENYGPLGESIKKIIDALKEDQKRSNSWNFPFYKIPSWRGLSGSLCSMTFSLF